MKQQTFSFHDQDEEPVLPSENPYSLFDKGQGFVHLCRNSKATGLADTDLYFIRAKSIGRGEVELLIPADEYERAVNRAIIQREDCPKSMTFLQFVRLLKFW